MLALTAPGRPVSEADADRFVVEMGPGRVTIGPVGGNGLALLYADTPSASLWKSFALQPVTRSSWM